MWTSKTTAWVLRLLNKTIEKSSASARNPKDNGVCMLRGVLLRWKWRRLTSAIFGDDNRTLFVGMIMIIQWVVVYQSEQNDHRRDQRACALCLCYVHPSVMLVLRLLWALCLLPCSG
jgi:hypothetical protein